MEYDRYNVRPPNELDERKTHATLIVHVEGQPDEVLELTAFVGMYLTKKEYTEYLLTNNLRIHGRKFGIIDEHTEFEMYKGTTDLYPEIVEQIRHGIEQEAKKEIDKEKENE